MNSHPNETHADPVRILKTHGLEDIHPDGFIRSWLDAAQQSILVDGDEVIALIRKSGIVRNVEVLKKPVKLSAKVKTKPAVNTLISARSEANVRYLVQSARRHMQPVGKKG